MIDHKDTNRMGPNNLGLIFAPNLLRCEVEVDSLSQSLEGARVLSSFLVDFETIFPVRDQPTATHPSARLPGPAANAHAQCDRIRGLFPHPGRPLDTLRF